MNLWLVVAVMGVVTYALRLSFVGLPESIREPETLRRALRLVPAAVLTALVVPALAAPHQSVWIHWENARLWAGIGAAVVAWQTRNVPLTVLAGMVLLWVQQWIQG